MKDLRSHGEVLVLATVCLGWLSVHCTAAEVVRREGVVVSYTGISQHYAEAIARTVAAARAVAIEQFGFDMPQTITVTATCDPQSRVRLFNDGQDRFSLTIRSESDLRRPSVTGIFQLYGLCHEVGHLAMYRPIGDHSWMTTAAAEGWAHYLGSRIVDEVYAREGADLWPDRYEYLDDGMKRLESQLASGEPPATVQGAGLWKQLHQIVGDKGVAPIFEVWGKTQFDPADPGQALGRVLSESTSDARVSDWWGRAEDILLRKRPKSSFAARKATIDQLVGERQELAHDDGQQAGKRSFAGGGHAVRFQAPGDSFYLMSIRIYGSRYGHPRPPEEDFHVSLCDKDFKLIADFPFPYSTFKRGPPEWVSLKVQPTNVPPEFIVCVGFNPTATKGVYVGYDGKGSNNSLIGLPGEVPRPFQEGDWMIRATLVESRKK